MNNKIQLGVAGVIVALSALFAFWPKTKKKAAVKNVENDVSSKIPENNIPEDVAAKQKIMSELGKKGAAKSAQVRKAKAMKKKKEKQELLDNLKDE